MFDFRCHQIEKRYTAITVRLIRIASRCVRRTSSGQSSVHVCVIKFHIIVRFMGDSFASRRWTLAPIPPTTNNNSPSDTSSTRAPAPPPPVSPSSSIPVLTRRRQQHVIPIAPASSRPPTQLQEPQMFNSVFPSAPPPTTTTSSPVVMFQQQQNAMRNRDAAISQAAATAANVRMNLNRLLSTSTPPLGMEELPSSPINEQPPHVISSHPPRIPTPPQYTAMSVLHQRIASHARTSTPPNIAVDPSPIFIIPAAVPDPVKLIPSPSPPPPPPAAAAPLPRIMVRMEKDDDENISSATTASSEPEHDPEFFDDKQQQQQQHPLHQSVVLARGNLGNRIPHAPIITGTFFFSLSSQNTLF